MKNNKYLKFNMDNDYKETLDKERIRLEKGEISKKTS